MEEEIEMCYSITEKKKKKSIFLFWGGDLRYAELLLVGFKHF
jgi:hypothetical protein